MAAWVSAGKGVRYREHEVRNYRGRPDRYYTIRFKINGRLVEEALGWASEGWNATKAVIEREKLRQAHRTGEGPATLAEKRQRAEDKRQDRAAENERQRLESMTFSKFMEKDYLPWAKANKKHWRDDQRRYKVHLAVPLGDKPLQEITPFLLEGLKRGLQDKGLAPATVKHVLVIIRQVYNKCILWGKWAGSNPVKGIKLPKLDNAKVRVLTPEEEDQLLRALKGKSRQVYDMAVMSLYAGLRFAEIAAMHWQDIDIERNRIYVRGKGGKTREVPLAPTLRKILEERRLTDATPADLVFPDQNGNIQRRISSTYYRTVAALGLNAGQDRRFTLDFHSLRHTFATRLASQGTPLNILRDLLGHADFQMVSRYSHEAPSLADEAIRILDQESNDRRSDALLNLKSQ
jgi:integrase